MGGAELETDEQKASYSIGRNIGAQIAEMDSRIDYPALMRGLTDGVEGVESPISEEELQTAMDVVNAAMEEERRAERDAESAANVETGDAFRADFAASEGVSTTASGLMYEVLVLGEGDAPAADDRVEIHYTGTLVDGTEFDSSRGGPPAQFSLGGVIPGFSEALQLMRPGSTFRVVMPPELAYGPSGGGSIGPNATLVFEIELIQVLDD